MKSGLVNMVRAGRAGTADIKRHGRSVKHLLQSTTRPFMSKRAADQLNSAGKNIKSCSFPTFVLAAILGAVSVSGQVSSAFAQQAWDGASPGDNTANGGAGTWDGSGGGSAWVNGGASGGYDPSLNAVFGVTGGAVNVSNYVAIQDLTFDADGYVITGGSLDLADNTTTITVTNLGHTASIANNLYTDGITDYDIIKAGAGTLAFSGLMTDINQIRLNAGTLSIQTSHNARNIVAASGTTLDLANGAFINSSIFSSGLSINQTGGSATFQGGISGSVGLTKTGTGTIIFTGVSDTTGAITISEGTLELQSGHAISDTSAVSNSATLTVSNDETIGSIAGGGTVNLNSNLTAGGNNSSTSFAGVISGAGGLTKEGTGTLTLSGANTYTGGTTVAGGTLSLGHNNAAGTGTITTTGSVIDYANGVTISNTINVDSNTTQLQVLTGTATQSGVISETSGPRPIEKIGSGTLVLSGANTYTGTTTITSGLLELQGGSAIANTGEVTLSNMAGAQLTVTNSETIGSLNGGGTTGGNVSIASGQILTTGDAGNDTFAGVISGAGGLTKQGTGALTLTGSNTYTGTTTITSGTLELQGGSAIADTGAVSVSGGATLTVTNDETIGSIAGGGTVNLNSNLTAGGNNSSTSFSGAMSGTGGLIKQGTGTLTLTGSNTYTGATTISAGTLQLGGSERISNSSDLVINGGILDLNNATETVANLSGTFGEIQTGGTSGNLRINQTVDGTYAGNWTGASAFGQDALTKSGAAKLTLSGTNTTTGTAFVYVNAGTLAVTGGNAIGDESIVSVNSGGVFLLEGNETINNLGTASGGSQTDLNGQTLTLGGDSSASGFVSTSVNSGGDITGNGTIILNDSAANSGFTNILTLGTATSFTGAVDIQSFRLSSSVANVFQDSIDVTLAADTRAQWEIGAADTIGSLTTGVGSQVNLSNAGSILTTNGDNSSTTIAGTIIGSGGLVKEGTGTLTLTGSNTYTGGTTVAGGTLSLGHNNAAGTGTITTTGSVIDYVNGVTISNAINVNSNTTQLQVLTGTATQSGVISETTGPRPVEKIGSGTLVLSGVNTYTGTTTVSGGTLDVTGSLAGDVSVDSGATLQVDGASIVDTATVTVNSGGTMNLTGSETIGALTGAGTVGLNANTLTTGDAGNDTFSGIISGSGGLSKQGAGTLTLSGVNTYTGTTFVIEGGLEITGSLTGSAEFDTGTNAFGTGTFGDLLIKSGATLRPGTAAGSIANLNTGNLTLAAGSTFEIDVKENGNSVGNRDQLNVTGTVTLGGSNLNILGAAGTYAGTPIDYTIISNDGADAVTGTFDTITDDLAFLEASVDYTGGDGNDVILTLTDSVKLSELGGTNPNQSSVGGALENVDTTPGSAGETLINKIKGLTSGQAQKTYQDLAGDVHTSNMQNLMNVGGNVGGQVGGRIANITGGRIGAGGNGFGYTAALETINANSSNQYFSTELAVQNGEEISYGYTPANANELQVWGGISGYYANVESDGNAQGTVSSGFGAVLGGDRTAGYSTWGAAFGYSKTTTSSHDSLSELGMNSFSGTLYTLQELGDFNISGLTAYTYHKIDGKRSISNINATALSDYHAHQVTLQGEISRTYTFDYNKDISPFLLGRYMHVSTSAYTETGAGAANLVSAGENYWSLDLVLGARMDIEINARTKVTFGAGYAHRFGDASPDANYTFSGGGTFTTQGVARNRHSAFLEAGFEKAFSDTSTFFAKANAELTDTHQSIGGNIGFKMRF